MQGSVGFGANVVAVPLLALIDPALVPGPILLAGFGINILMLWRDRHSASLRPVASAIAGRVAGTVCGVVALVSLGRSGLSVLVAAIVLIMLGFSFASTTPNRSIRNLMGAGALSGFGASTAGIGGPPVALMFRDAKGPEIRGSLGAFFVVGNIISLTGLAVAGRFGPTEIRLGLALIPAALGGFASTKWLVPLLDRGYMRPAIVGLSAASAFALVGRLIID